MKRIVVQDRNGFLGVPPAIPIKVPKALILPATQALGAMPRGQVLTVTVTTADTPAT
jgi:hypothetical protein